MGRKLVAVGGARPQMRKASARSWTKAKARRFVEVLADTLNVTEACRESGVSVPAAYRRRQTDAAFRAAWAQSLAEGYSRLELVLLERAFVGTEKIVRRRDGSEELMREYPNQLAMQLLKMHRESAREAEPAVEEADDFDELKERLLRRLQRMKERDERQGSERPQAAEGSQPGTSAEDRRGPQL